MRELDVNEVKQLELDILKDIANFCDNNNIVYYLCGGTLIGAVRHKGFIPWDDDIDIAMPRNDYLKFINSYNNKKSRYIVNSIENNPDWHMAFARVEDLFTTMYEETLINKYRKCHVFVDVFPIDGIPNDEKEEKSFMLKQKFLGIVLNASSFRFFPSKHYSDSKESHVTFRNILRTCLKYIAIVLFRPINTQWIARCINSNSLKYDIESSNNIGLTVFVWNWKFEKASKSAFSERMLFKFEDANLFGPKGYDEYLTKTYGDYMTPPPIENQVSHHSFKTFMNN